MAQITYREAVSRALREALEDERVFLMGEDIGSYGGAYAVTKGLLVEYGPDRPDARPHEVVSEVFDLFAALDATEAQLGFPVIFSSATGEIISGKSERRMGDT